MMITLLHKKSSRAVTNATIITNDVASNSLSISIANCMIQQGIPLCRDHIYSLLQLCFGVKDDISSIRMIHTHILYGGLDSFTVFNDHLIRIYASCKCLKEAEVVFKNVEKPSSHTWNAIISAYASAGEHERAFQFYEQMQQVGFAANKYIFQCVLNACLDVESLEKGLLIHDHVIRASMESDIAVGSGIVALYVRHGILDEATKVFESLPNRDVVLWSIMITGYYENRQYLIALKLFHQMEKEGIKADVIIFLGILKACGRVEYLEQGRLMHCRIILYGLESDISLGRTLIDMYAKCEGFLEAQHVFDKLDNKDIVSWNSLIASYLPRGYASIEVFESMQEQGILADKITYLYVLKACGNSKAFRHGICLHNQVVRDGMESDIEIGSILISMHAKCGRLHEARNVFNKMLNRDTVAWSAMIGSYVDNEQANLAIELFDQMMYKGIAPIEVTLIYVLKACGDTRDVEKGRFIHNHAIQNGLILYNNIVSAVVDMYARCSELSEAKKVFDSLLCQDIVAWGIIIAAYAQNGHGEFALVLFEKMQRQGLKADKSMYLCILKVCGTSKAIIQGRLMHDQLMKSKYPCDVSISNALIGMYAECGMLEDACNVFNILSDQDATSWGALIAGCAENGYEFLALKLFFKMHERDLIPEKAIVVCVLSACSCANSIRQARLMHNYIILNQFDKDVVIGNSLIDMYCKCESMSEAQSVFNQMLDRDGNSWNLMISGHSQHGQGLAALKIFEKMQNEDEHLNTVVFSCTLKACSIDRLPIQGRILHHRIITNRMETDLVVANTLIDMYSKCGYLCDARKVFDNLKCRDEFSWGAMIMCHALHDDNYEVLKLYMRMEVDGVKADVVTSSCTLKACGGIGALKHGRLLHDRVIRSGIDVDVVISTALIDMYARCGSSMEAHQAFEKAHIRNEVSWTALISAFVQDGNFELVRKCLKHMLQDGFMPDGQTFTSILAAYSNSGRMDASYQCLESMNDVHEISPTIEHMNCIIDTLARVGHLHEAEELLQTMPMPPDSTGWVSLLTACQTYGNMGVGWQCLNEVVKMDLCGTGSYMTIANICAVS